MGKISRRKIFKALAKYLDIHQGPIIDDISDDDDNLYVVYRDDVENELVFAKVYITIGKFEKENFKREDFEDLVSEWIAGYSDDDGCKIRGDIINMRIVAEDRVLLRHTKNVFS